MTHCLVMPRWDLHFDTTGPKFSLFVNGQQIYTLDFTKPKLGTEIISLHQKNMHIIQSPALGKQPLTPGLLR